MKGNNNNHRMDWFEEKPLRSKKGSLEVRLFYVRVASCPLDGAPQVLTLRHHQRAVGSTFEINGTHIPPSEASTLTLRRDRVDRDAAETTYVSTDSVRTTGTLDFEVCDRENNLLLCGGLERQEEGWTMDCWYPAAAGSGSLFTKGSGFKHSGSPTVEVYVAGCCSGSPLILTKTIALSSPKKKSKRGGGGGMLDVIPEDDETDKMPKSIVTINHTINQVSDEFDLGEFDDKVDQQLGNYYQEGAFIEGEDGELSWFNAGVRVGVGIGLGMCLGLGIGVGLLMRTYQATTRTFRRRLL